MEDEGEEPSWEVWLGGGTFGVTFLPPWYPTLLLYCSSAGEGMKELLSSLF